MANRRGVKIAAGAAALGVVAAIGLLALRHRGPQLAPDFAVTDLRGHAVRLSAFRGRVVLLNLWTTWCAPCREEMPSMERLWTRLRAQDFQLLAVSQDEDGRKAVEPFVQELGLTFPVLLDPERQVGERYGVWGYPETFVIDRNGYVVERVIGPRDWSTPEAVASLEAVIGAGGAGSAGAAARAPGRRAPS
jgi:peroxiredoxin